MRVEVTDLSSRPPRQRRPDGEDTNGRGLELVSGLADRWGWQREGAGKRIWCELDRSDDRGCVEAPAELAGAAVQLAARVGSGEAEAPGAAVARPHVFRA